MGGSSAQVDLAENLDSNSGEAPKLTPGGMEGGGEGQEVHASPWKHSCQPHLHRSSGKRDLVILIFILHCELVFPSWEGLETSLDHYNTLVMR